MMSTVKSMMIAIVEQQSDDSSYDEILRELDYTRMILRGLDDADAGRVMADHEMNKRTES